MKTAPLLEIQDLTVHFPIRRHWWERIPQWLRAVDGVSLQLAPGETVGLVGESGCGKSTLGRAVIRLVDPTSGRVIFDGRDLATLSDTELRVSRRRFQMIFQDPYGSLNPRRTVGESLGEALDIHGLTPQPAARRQRIHELLQSVGLYPAHASRYPHEFSGGQRQRIGIARALAVAPQLIVCDEPVSALDVSVQAQIINLLCDLQRAHGIAYLFIAHDLAVVGHVSQRILVMYLGKVVEMAEARQLLHSPQHPYTQALISAIPVVDPDRKRRRIVLSGEVPSPMQPPPGCPFHPRCPVAEARCRVETPTLRATSPAHWTACHLAKGVGVD